MHESQDPARHDLLSDSDLLERIIVLRDERSFRALFRRHSPRLLRLLMRLAGGVQADAEDLLQETWMRAVTRMEQLREREGFYAWLRGIAVHVYLGNRRREMRRHAILPVRSGALEGADAMLGATHAVEERSPVTQDETLDLERAISELPHGQRTVLVLHDIEGFTHEEIAEQLGIAVGTAKSQLSDARRRVRRTLSGPTEKEGQDARSG